MSLVTERTAPPAWKAHEIALPMRELLQDEIVNSTPANLPIELVQSHQITISAIRKMLGHCEKAGVSEPGL